MGNILSMRKFSKEDRLQGYSHPDIADGFADVTAKTARRYKLKYNGNKLRPGPMLNALAVWFLELDESERASRMQAMVARLEAFMAEPETGSKDRSGEDQRDNGHETYPEPAPQSRPKRKQG